MAGRQVAIVRCRDYQSDLVDAAVRRSVDLLGGIERFVSPGQRVMLKTNLLSPSTPDRLIVTHPSVVAAMARLVKEAGGTAIIADSPGGPFTRSRLEQCYRKAGLYEVAEATGASLNFDTRSIQVPHPQGHLVKRLDLMQLIEEVDVIIGLAKMKTHALMTFTGATKLMFGLVPGLTKPGYHGKLSGADRFAEMLLDLVSYVKPALTVMDAVVGMEGNGPSGGDPRNVGLILAGVDTVAVDLVAASVVGIDPLKVLTIRAAVRRGNNTGRLADVEVLGESVENVKVPAFKLPAKGMDMDSMPPLLRNLVVNQLVLRPWPDPKRCTRCGVCRQNCPVGAVTLDGGSPAKINQEKCIRCYCCHELCPETAIELKRSANLLARGGR